MAYMIKQGKGPSGKTRYKVRWRNNDGTTSSHTVTGYDEALAYKNTVEGNAIEGILTKPRNAKRPFTDVAADWRAACQLRGKVASSCERDATICRLHIEPVIGKRRIGTLTDEDVQSLVNRWSAKYAPSTVIRHYAVLSAILGFAVRKRLIPSSPCVDIALPIVDAIERPILDGTELSQVALALGEDLAPMMWLGVEGGLRWGEVAGLTADRVDLNHGRVTIDRQLNRSRDLAPVKNKHRRTFAISPQLTEDLVSLFDRKCITSDDSDHLLFADRDGKPLHYSKLASTSLEVRLRWSGPSFPPLPRPSIPQCHDSGGSRCRPKDHSSPAGPRRHFDHARHLCPPVTSSRPFSR